MDKYTFNLHLKLYLIIYKKNIYLLKSLFLRWLNIIKQLNAKVNDDFFNPDNVDFKTNGDKETKVNDDVMTINVESEKKVNNLETKIVYNETKYIVDNETKDIDNMKKDIDDKTKVIYDMKKDIVDMTKDIDDNTKVIDIKTEDFDDKTKGIDYKSKVIDIKAVDYDDKKNEIDEKTSKTRNDEFNVNFCIKNKLDNNKNNEIEKLQSENLEIEKLQSGKPQIIEEISEKALKKPKVIRFDEKVENDENFLKENLPKEKIKEGDVVLIRAVCNLKKKEEIEIKNPKIEEKLNEDFENEKNNLPEIQTIQNKQDVVQVIQNEILEIQKIKNEDIDIINHAENETDKINKQENFQKNSEEIKKEFFNEHKEDDLKKNEKEYLNKNEEDELRTNVEEDFFKNEEDMLNEKINLDLYKRIIDDNMKLIESSGKILNLNEEYEEGVEGIYDNCGHYYDYIKNISDANFNEIIDVNNYNLGEKEIFDQLNDTSTQQKDFHVNLENHQEIEISSNNNENTVSEDVEKLIQNVVGHYKTDNLELNSKNINYTINKDNNLNMTKELETHLNETESLEKNLSSDVEKLIQNVVGHFKNEDQNFNSMKLLDKNIYTPLNPENNIKYELESISEKYLPSDPLIIPKTELKTNDASNELPKIESNNIIPTIDQYIPSKGDYFLNFVSNLKINSDPSPNLYSFNYNTPTYNSYSYNNNLTNINNSNSNNYLNNQLKNNFTTETKNPNNTTQNLNLIINTDKSKILNNNSENENNNNTLEFKSLEKSKIDFNVDDILNDIYSNLKLNTNLKGLFDDTTFSSKNNIDFTGNNFSNHLKSEIPASPYSKLNNYDINNPSYQSLYNYDSKFNSDSFYNTNLNLENDSAKSKETIKQNNKSSALENIEKIIDYKDVTKNLCENFKPST